MKIVFFGILLMASSTISSDKSSPDSFDMSEIYAYPIRYGSDKNLHTIHEIPESDSETTWKIDQVVTHHHHKEKWTKKKSAICAAAAAIITTVISGAVALAVHFGS